MTHRIFLLSPARCDGRRAATLLREGAAFELARRLRAPAGAALGEVFSFMSGLYFRGKLAYAEAFRRAPRGLSGALVITAGRGLVPAETRITVEDLRAMAAVDVDPAEPRFVRPLARDARRLARRLGGRDEVVLLGSVATGKYIEPLLEILGERLRFPKDFVGRGDMSRGGLMLRCVEAGRELACVAVSDVPRRGPRPPRLAPRAR